MAKQKILIVDDERLLRWSLRRKCEEWGYNVEEAENCAQAQEQIDQSRPDLALLDVRLPDGNGVDLLQRIVQNSPGLPVLMITADPKVEDIKRAIRLGAFDYLTKPVDFDELQLNISNALENLRLREQVGSLREQIRNQSPETQFVAPSPKMQTLLAFVRKVAGSEASAVLIQGESGVGKDLIARVLHEESPRREFPFVAVNCSAIPEQLLEAEILGHERGAFTDAKTMKRGLMETAHRGTLFLDEIGEMPMLLQSKLLRLLEDQTFRRVGGVKDIRVDVRIVAASNRNLAEAVRNGQFREDLFYRLMVIPIFIPPLRHHPEDVLPLARHFIAHYNLRFRKNILGLTPEAEALITRYDWPGNVREIKNAIQRAMILEEGPYIRPTYLPLQTGSDGPMRLDTAFPEPTGEEKKESLAWRKLANGRALPHLVIPPQGTSLKEVERLLVERALQRCGGNQSRAARLLDISRDAMRYKMKKFGLEGEGEGHAAEKSESE